MVTKPDITFAGGGVDVDAEAAHAGFAFKKRHVLMRFRVFQRDPEIGTRRQQYAAVIRDFKRAYPVVFLGVENLVFVDCEGAAKVDIVTI